MKKKVLTVDDSRTIRNMLLVTLNNAGFETIQAEDGVEGLEVLVEVTAPVGWDHHFLLKDELTKSCEATDRPIAALLSDLQQRGMLSDTLIIWAGEFGRTPGAEHRDGEKSRGNEGRDHHPYGFSIWLAGGGIRGGQAYGATDDFGYRAIAHRTQTADLHATILHLLGIDHERLTYRYSGRDYRLTDVGGRVVKEIVA